MRLECITHGRHCTCSACAREDWTNPDLAPCGMHGSSCPREYQPWGSAGTNLVTDEMVERAAVAMEDAAIRWLGRDLGTIHRNDIAREALEAALNEDGS